MKEVIKLIEKIVSEKHLDAHQGLNTVLDFLIAMFDVTHHLSEGGWLKAVAKAQKEEPHLYHIMIIWMGKVADAMDKGAWIDFFGGLYEEMYQSKGKASTLGQFYTPKPVCDVMAFCCSQNIGRINDPACGSGRTLLAVAAQSGFSRYNFYTGGDIDLASVKMCALNLMIHGCRGKVVCADSLKNPSFFNYGFRINDIRYPMQSPFYSLTKISYLEK